MDSFFIYRLPGGNIFAGGAGSVKSGIGTDGFLISSFYNLQDATLTIEKQDEFTHESLREYQEGKLAGHFMENRISPIFPFPDCSTSKENYIEDVKGIISGLGENEKTVYCRAICGKKEIDLAETLISLDKSFPGAMVFCFHTPQSGTWIGATPEKLLESFDEAFSTVALAGTRMAAQDKPWDSKNIKEQGMVADYIAEILTRHGLSFTCPPQPTTKKVGNLEHLCTDFHATGLISKDREQILDFLYDLSPTPALCGFPKKKSFDTIRNRERFSRAYYGGFAGPLFPNGNFSLYVILRAIRKHGENWCMYAGGGITAYSVPDSEWEETENKASSILEKLKFR